MDGDVSRAHLSHLKKIKINLGVRYIKNIFEHFTLLSGGAEAVVSIHVLFKAKELLVYHCLSRLVYASLCDFCECELIKH